MNDCLDYEHTHRFSKLFLDYIKQKSSIKPYNHRFPNLDNFKAQIQEKQNNYKASNRKILVDTLNEQYKNFKVSKQTQKHIDDLAENNTFTVTTGHQLNLFTGPLYTFYKIISVLKTCKQLKNKYKDYNFVPVFWLASEDHDFEEINHFYFKNHKYSWDKEALGAVGELNTQGLNDTFDNFKKALPNTKNAENLIDLFKKAYLEHDTLSQASIYLYNELFGEEGLVVLEPNHEELKSCFKNQVRQELFSQTTFKEVSSTSKSLTEEGYHEQVTPREINLFYKDKNLRKRILLKNEKYFVNQTDIVFTENEIIEEVENHPDKFSPNALMRPLYQEVLLPNLSYVGGAGELAYWLQLKSTFKAFDVSFPMLQMRNTALLFSEKTHKKLDKLHVEVKDLFQPPIDLKNQHTKNISEIKIDFSPQKQHLSQQFKDLYKLAEQTDKTFLNAVAAQEQKQHNGLDKLEKRLLKAQRRKMADELERLTKLQNTLFPNQNLQERVVNFTELYLTYGDDFIPFLYKNLEPLKFKFSLIELEPYPKSLKQKLTS